MNALTSTPTIFLAEQVPYISADEAASLLRTELDRFLALMESLGPEDWNKPTACTAWTVRDILAHQAGGYASGTGYKEMIRQYMRAPKKGQLPEDAVNENQLAERSGKTPADLITELRQVGPAAVENWAYHFGLVKWVNLPHPVGGNLSLRHLMWVIHSRDTWMHRLDICRATGRKFEQTAAHDGRIAALVMRDVSEVLAKKQNKARIVFELSGIAGGTWGTGQGNPASTIQMDVLDFNVYGSGRMSYEDARTKAVITGDVESGEQALKSILILF